ncbi:UDP-galactopyranose mutase [Enterococcus alishanensis]|uniref:UDP-galactopyranose mutase n=1 Tax=Enterococcus alishanensis TaxID=1303817 RepID=A0ABS6TDZ1_9ENTE|nr:UDP-galactopyranose mutase [Enterococcus alishanensis]MBV7391106.1 UDP-galactopyranose mutase [Enterococcus alishanensis]
MNLNKHDYDYLIVGSGFFGSIWAREAAETGKKVLLIERRDHIAGNMYTYSEEGITIHQYGPHIFHTDNQKVWDYVNRFTTFKNYINQVVANYRGELYNLPFNMNTFYQMWGVKTPAEAKLKIQQQQKAGQLKQEPQNLEEQAIHLIGQDIYQKLIKGYTEKQWGRKTTELPPSIIKRLPVRFTFDNNYFNHQYQGIPANGYTELFENLLDHPNIDVQINTDFFDQRKEYIKEFPKIIFTGMIDQFFDYQFGHLEYRSVRFENELVESDNVQGNAVINYTDFETPFTRSIEWRHFDKKGNQNKSILSKEYPTEWTPEKEAYYPVNDEKNTQMVNRYRSLAEEFPQFIFGGRLGEYKYYDMDQVIASALASVEKHLKE